MILQFDVGNTRLKWRLIKNSETVDRGSAALREFKVDSIEIDGELGEVQLAAVRKGCDLDSLVESLKLAYPAVDIYQAESADRFGPVRFAYALPETQGVDRCLAMLAAYTLSSGLDDFKGVMVIDAGSAITVDVLDDKGMQVEGYILPGLAMMREALLDGTSKISAGYQAKAGGVAMLSTRECVDQGVKRAFAAGVRDFIASAKSAGLVLVITGGDALRVGGLISGSKYYLVEDLVLDGLSILAAEGVA